MFTFLENHGIWINRLIVEVVSLFAAYKLKKREFIIPLIKAAEILKERVGGRLHKMIRYLRLFSNISNWWLYLAVKMGITAKDPLLFKTANQIRIEVHRRLLHEFKEIFMENCYALGLTSGVPNFPTVIDIGANVGFFSLFAASHFPGARIFAYEPVAKNFHQLIRNRDLNPNVAMTCVQKAVYAYSGKLKLELDPYGFAGETILDSDICERFTTSARVINDTTNPSTTIQVPCISLPDLLDVHGISICHLLKIDCEGAEYDILYNCPKVYLDRVEQIAMEVHRGPTPDRTIEGLSQFLTSCGFHTRRIDHMLYTRH